MKRLITLVVLSMLCATASAQWLLITKADDLHFYGDPATRRWEGTRVNAWILGNYTTPQMYQNKYYSSLKVQQQFDCKAERERVLYTVTYSNTMGNGNALWTDNSPNAEWTPIVPGSITGSVARWACGK